MIKEIQLNNQSHPVPKFIPDSPLRLENEVPMLTRLWNRGLIWRYKLISLRNTHTSQAESNKYAGLCKSFSSVKSLVFFVSKIMKKMKFQHFFTNYFKAWFWITCHYAWSLLYFFRKKEKKDEGRHNSCLTTNCLSFYTHWKVGFLFCFVNNLKMMCM